MPKKQPKERVTILYGAKNVLLACPHGFDDTYTNIITENAANALGCNALINHGWQRSKKVDETKSYANCNSVAHVMDAQNMAVNDEYGKPFQRMIQKMYQKTRHDPFTGGPRSHIYIFQIHGVGNWIKGKSKDQNLKVIIGNGHGAQTSSYSCKDWMAHRMGELFNGIGWKAYLGAGGSRYAARGPNNMNQWFRLHYRLDNVYSMQLELTSDLRSTEKEAEATGRQLGALIALFLQHKGVDPGVKTKLPEI